MQAKVADGIDVREAPIESGRLLARCSSSVGCRGPSAVTSRLVESRVADRSFEVVVGAVVGWVLRCGIVDTYCRRPCRRSVRRVAVPSSYTVRSRHARWHP